MPTLKGTGELAPFLNALHDCPFDLDRAAFAPDERVWFGVFLRPVWADPPSKSWRGLLRSKARLPVNEVRLSLRGVDSVTARGDQGIGLYSFDRLDGEPPAFRLLFQEVLALEFVVPDGVVADYAETALPGVTATYSQFLLLQTGPRLDGYLSA